MDFLNKAKNFFAGSLADQIRRNDLIRVSKAVDPETVNQPLVDADGARYQPLEYALMQRKPELVQMIRYFLTSGADIGRLTDDHNKPGPVLERGLVSGELIRLFYEAGVDLNILWAGEFNLLGRALYSEQHDQVTAVLDLIDRSGLTLIEPAAPFWHVLERKKYIPAESILAVLDAGVVRYEGSEDCDYSDALLFRLFNAELAEKTKQHVLDYMADNGFELALDRPYPMGRLLDLAISRSHRRLVTRLVELKADITGRENEVSRLLIRKEQLKANRIIDETLDLADLSDRHVRRFFRENPDLSGRPVVGPLIVNRRIGGSRSRWAQEAIERGADVNQLFRFNSTTGHSEICSPLYAVCCQPEDCFTREIAFLLEQGARDQFQAGDAGEEESHSALLQAIAHGRIPFVQTLLEGGVNPNLVLPGKRVSETARMDDRLWVTMFYPKHLSVQPNEAQKAEMFTQLMDAGLNPQLTNSRGETALDLAVRSGDLAMVRRMADNGFTTSGSAEALNQLFERCPDLSLLQRILEPVARPEISAETARHYFIGCMQRPAEQAADQDAIFALLLELGLKITDVFTDDEGTTETLIELAIQYRHETALRYLLQQTPADQIPADTVLYAIHYLQNETLIGDLVVLHPEYEIAELHRHPSGKYTEAGTPITLALHKKRWTLAHYLMDRFPQMRAHSNLLPLVEHSVLAMEAEKDSEPDLALIRKLIARDPDLERDYTDDHEGVRWSLLFQLCFRYALSRRDEAARNLWLQVIEMLLEAGASVAEPYSLDTAPVETHPDCTHLFAMVMYHNGSNFQQARPLYDLLIGYGADPARPVGSFNESAVASIVQRYPDHIDEPTALAFIQYLWQKTGFNLQEVNRIGNNLITAAAMPGRASIVRWLAEQGADIHHVGGFDHSNPIHKCISNYDFVPARDRTATVAALLDLGVDIEVPDPDPGTGGATPLMTACQVGVQAVVEYLLQRGADINAVAEGGLTPLLAAVNGDYCYDVHHTLEGSKVALVDYLVQQGADPNLMGKRRYHPLLEAAFCGRSAVFRRLLELGADPYRIDPDLKQETGGSIGFVQETPIDAEGMNPIGYLLLHEDQAAALLEILQRFLGADAMAQARQDIAEKRVPWPVKEASAEPVASPEPKPEPVPADKAEVADTAASVTSEATDDSVTTAEGLFAHQAEVLPDEETPLNLFRILRRGMGDQGMTLTVQMDYEQTESLIFYMQQALPAADMRRGDNWAGFLSAAVAERAPELAEILHTESDMTLCRLEIIHTGPAAQQMKALGEVFNALFATRRTLINALLEVQDKVQWQAFEPAQQPETDAQDNAAAPRLPVDELFLTSARFGLYNVSFKLNSPTMQRLAAAVKDFLPLAMEASDWCTLIRTVVEQEAGPIPAFAEFSVYGKDQLSVMMDNESDEQKAFVRAFSRALETLFHSEEAFVRTTMRVRHALLAES